MAAPVLMTLFTDDAVEVRYSDQSCLQLSPCGSTFVHHESPGLLIHPAHGMKTIGQRCEFVTSDYRQKVLQALDFRNRFAERPFVCHSLIEDDQIMALYAKITNVAWPKGTEHSNFEYMMDGGVRLISEDEYASIVLSPHKQDFTVCYLCGVSPDSPRQKLHTIKQQQTKSASTCIDGLKKYGQEPDKYHNSAEVMKYTTHSDKGMIQNTGSPDRADMLRNNLNLSPISLASTQMSRDSSPINESNTDINRYSTPTNIVQKRTEVLESLDGSFLQFAPKGEIGNIKTEVVSNMSGDAKEDNLSTKSKHSNQPINGRHVHWTSVDSGGSDTSQAGSIDGQSSSQILYTWISRHYSCEECPVSWNHVLNLARAVIDNKDELEKYSSTTSVHITQRPRGIPKMINPENYCMTPLPVSLPITCPGQHLHKQYTKYVHDSDRDMIENITALSKGKLKVVLIDGIVFRIVRLASTKFVEIYPGDGSVILSQGLSGHFYRHIIPRGKQIDERTYSVKTLPPTSRSAPYSIEKLIKRASRFLLQTHQEDKILTNKSVCCWKYKNNILMEPLASSLLEEVSVPGHGRFSAFSNGHVRILFEDRTSLDMSCDFTKRIIGCIEHSSNAEEKAILQQQLEQQSSLECRGKQGLCKLLLTSGQYQIVDSKQPGIYSKYTDAALEWAAWVNSSPAQRKIFYQNWNQPDDSALMVTKELQKIKCFNYLADNSLANTGMEQQKDTRFSEMQEPFAGNLQLEQCGHEALGKTQNYSSRKYCTGGDHFKSDEAPILKTKQYGHRDDLSKELEIIRGFNSVREALLRTSSAIKDIDEIIEKKGVKS